MKSLALIVGVAAFGLVLGGCQHDDACHGVDLGMGSCLTVRVDGQLDPGQHLVDALQVDLDETGTFVHRQVIGNLADGGVAAGLPIDFRIEFPYVADTDSYGNGVRVVAFLNGKAVGYGKQSFGFKRSTYSSIEVRLSPTKVSGCFDGVHLDNETDVDCGGSDCPACTLGQGCGFGSESYNCADARCGYQNSDETGGAVCGGQF